MAEEKTYVRILDLPEGRDWVWFSDANMIGLSRRLDAAGRERALVELQEHWRRNCLRATG